MIHSLKGENRMLWSEGRPGRAYKRFFRREFENELQGEGLCMKISHRGLGCLGALKMILMDRVRVGLETWGS